MRTLIVTICFVFLAMQQVVAQDIDTIKIHRDKELILRKLDSADHSGRRGLDTVSSIARKAQQSLDTLNPQHKLKTYEAKLNNLESRMTSRIDSLNSLGLSDTMLTKQLTQLKDKLDSVKSLGPAENIAQAQERIAALENGVGGKVKAVEGKISEKMGLFTSNGGNIPGSVSLPTTDLKVPGVNADLGVPGVNLPATGNPVSGFAQPELNTDLKIPNAQPRNIQVPDGIDNAKEKLGSLGEVSNQVKGYQGDLQEIQNGDLANTEQLPKALESKVEGMDQLKGFKEQAGSVDAMKKKLNDPAVMKEEALNRAKEAAVNHFAGHEQELKHVIEKMSELKSKIPNPQGPIDLFKKRQQFMKGKPIVERVVPGFTFQFQKQQSFWMDLNLHAGFKISGRWLAGTGWNERLAYDFKHDRWDKKHRIYGVRNFVHFMLRENLWLKADVESMNAPFRPHGFKSNAEITGRKWIWSYLAGVKKDFQFSKSFKGNVQMLYNFYDPERDSPYLTRFNVRMGFEWR